MCSYFFSAGLIYLTHNIKRLHFFPENLFFTLKEILKLSRVYLIQNKKLILHIVFRLIYHSI